MISPQESVVPDDLKAEPLIPADHRNQMAKIAIDLAVFAMNAPTPEFRPLSARQTQLIELVSLGYHNGQIAQELNISEETVKGILCMSFEKLGAKNRSHAVYRAFEEGVIERKEEIKTTEINELNYSEHQVLQLIAKGHTDKEIALERRRSVETVKSQVRKILEKLGASNRTGAVRVAIEADILSTQSDEIKNRRKILETASFLVAFAFTWEGHNEENEDTTENKPRSGMYLDWIAETLIVFNGRTLRLSDVAGVVYQEEYDPKRAWVSANRINAQINNPKSASSLENRLSQRGYKYFRFHVKQPRGAIEVRLMCAPTGTDVGVEDINESTRPNDEEIKEIAAKIRQDEISYGRQKAEEKAGRTAQKERERQERDNNTPLGRLAVFLGAHKNEPFPIAELAPIAFPDSVESLAVLKQKISKIINDGSLHKRLDEREASLHKASFRPDGYIQDTAVLMVLKDGEHPDWQIPEKVPPFWQEQKAEKPLIPQYGVRTAWLVTAFRAFRDRPLSYDDLAKILYAEEYDSGAGHVLTGRVNSLLIQQSRVRKELSNEGLKLWYVSVKSDGGRTPPGVRMLCLTENEIQPGDIDESKRPTNDELRELAVRLREEELVAQQAPLPARALPIFVNEAREAGLFGDENIASGNLQARTQNIDLRRPKTKTKPKRPTTVPAKTPNGSIYERIEKAPSEEMFRSNVVRALPKVDKALKADRGRPDSTQLFVLRDPEILVDLLERGIISKEDYAAQEIDRAAVVAAMLIRSGLAKGFLDEDKAVQSMGMIRSEERKYLQRLEDNSGPPKSR